jgi:hypothetical protein
MSGNGEPADEGDEQHPERHKDGGRASEWFSKAHRHLGDEVRVALRAYDTVRRASTWMHLSGEDKQLAESGDLEDIAGYSAKTAELIRVLDRETSASGKHYAYTEFNMTCDGRSGWNPGVQAVGKALERGLGYERLWLDDVQELLKLLGLRAPTPHAGADGAAGAVPVVTDPSDARAIVDKYLRTKLGRDPRGVKLYVILVSTGFQNRPPAGSDTSSGRELTDEQKKRAASDVQALYNCAANKLGGLVHVCLASGKYNEGIDLQGVQHLHIVEPFRSMASEMQTLGRARRNCSHVQLGFDADWAVHVYRYMAVLSPGFSYEKKAPRRDGAGNAVPTHDHFALFPKGHTTIDQVVAKGRVMSHNKLEIVYEIIKQRAVDCRLFSDFHGGTKCNQPIGEVLAVHRPPLADSVAQDKDQPPSRPRNPRSEPGPAPSSTSTHRSHAVRARKPSAPPRGPVNAWLNNAVKVDQNDPYAGLNNSPTRNRRQRPIAAAGKRMDPSVAAKLRKGLRDTRQLSRRIDEGMSAATRLADSMAKKKQYSTT